MPLSHTSLPRGGQLVAIVEDALDSPLPPRHHRFLYLSDITTKPPILCVHAAMGMAMLATPRPLPVPLDRA